MNENQKEQFTDALQEYFDPGGGRRFIDATRLNRICEDVKHLRDNQEINAKEMTERIQKIELKMAYYAGGTVTLMAILQLIIRFFPK